jgi:hypothetical protein
MSSLRTRLHDLASSFADDVLAAIRTASLDELVANSQGAGNGRRARVAGDGGQPDPLHAPKAKTNGSRLARRSAEDIAKTLGLVVAAVKATKGKGMRAEELRDFLKLDKRELPRVIEEGLKAKKLKSKGQKRGTTYFAA